MYIKIDPPDYRRLIRLNIARFRHERGLTQEQLSEAIDKSPQYISQIEGENSQTFPSVTMLAVIADKLQIPLFWLFYMDGQPMPFSEE